MESHDESSAVKNEGQWIEIQPGSVAKLSLCRIRDANLRRLAYLINRKICRGGTSDSVGPPIDGRMVGRRGLPAAGPTLLIRQNNKLASRSGSHSDDFTGPHIDTQPAPRC